MIDNIIQHPTAQQRLKDLFASIGIDLKTDTETVTGLMAANRDNPLYSQMLSCFDGLDNMDGSSYMDADGGKKWYDVIRDIVSKTADISTQVDAQINPDTAVVTREDNSYLYLALGAIVLIVIAYFVFKES